MNAIQETIRAYLQGKSGPSQHDLLCFVGMLETGEATLADFHGVGGDKLVAQIMDKQSNLRSTQS